MPLPETMSHGNGDDAVDGDDIYRAEESDSGSEEVFGSRTVIYNNLIRITDGYSSP